jgi:hypothetical protein
MHKKAQFGKDFDGATAGQRTIVGVGVIFLLLVFFPQPMWYKATLRAKFEMKGFGLR